MLQYSTWKYVVAAFVIALSVFYSIPNLYPKQPAVQIAANHGDAVDAALVSRVQGVLAAAKQSVLAVAIEEGNVVVRVADGEQQTAVSDLLSEQLGSDY